MGKLDVTVLALFRDLQRYYTVQLSPELARKLRIDSDYFYELMKNLKAYQYCTEIKMNV